MKIHAAGVMSCIYAAMMMQAQVGPGKPMAEPVQFAPGIVSTPQHGCPTFAPDGKTVYFARHTPGPSALMVSRLQDGQWSTPELLPFSGPGSGRFFDGDPAMSPDGKVF